MKQPLLELSNMNTYIGASHILFNISLYVNPGQVVCIMGRNGAGKSTLLKSIIGLFVPVSGSLKFLGEEILESKDFQISKKFVPHRMAQIGLGYVPEDKRIFLNMTVRENLIVAAKPGRLGAKYWTEERVYEFFPQLKIMMNRKAQAMSGGERQMLAIGRALMGNPDLLLLDEPSSGLAPKVTNLVAEQLAQLKKTGISVLMVEQNAHFISAIGDYVYMLENGIIQNQCLASEFLSSPALRLKYLSV